MGEDEVKTKRNIKPFNGQKYSIWKLRVRALLDEKDVLHVIDNPLPTAFDDKWDKDDKKAKRIMIEYLSDSMVKKATITGIHARDVFRSYDALYERTSLATQMTIEKKLLSFKLEPGTNLSEHFMKFDDMLVELEAAGGQLNEANKIARLLLSLPVSYEPKITAIQTLKDDAMNLDYVKIQLLDYEIKLKTENNDLTAKVLNIEVSQNYQPRRYNGHKGKWKNNNQNFKPKPYGQFNKSVKNFSKYPNKKAGSYSKTNFNKCVHCGRRNHAEKDCFYKQQGQNSDQRQRSVQSVQAENNSERIAFMCDVEKFFTSKTIDHDRNKSIFLLDSGATDHLVNEIDLFTSVEDLEIPLKISIAKKGESIFATKKGSIEMVTNLGLKGTLNNVLYAPEIPHNLLSVRRIQEAGMNVIFSKTGGVVIKRGNQKILNGKPMNNLICITLEINKNASKNTCHQAKLDENSTRKTYKLWHERLGHINKTKFLEIKRNNLLDTTHLLERVDPINETCEACIYGKQARLPFSKEKDRAHVIRPLFTIHSDVCGPITPSTNNDKNYFVTFIDQYTHYTVVYLISQKSEVFRCFQDFVAKSETHFNLKVAHLYCDNGREYLSNEFKDFCAQKGIQYHLTIPYTPQLNSIAERMNRTLVEKARSMIYGADLNKQLWGEAVLTATYLINLSPTKAISQDKTPYELWHNKKPRIDHLRIFGCTVYIHNKTRKSKFDKKSFKGILVGYEQNGYRVLNTELNKIITARDVIFDEVNYKETRPSMHNKEIENGTNIKRLKDHKSLGINEENMNNNILEEMGTKTQQEMTNPLCVDASPCGDNNTSSDINEIGDKPVEDVNEGIEIRRSQRIKNRPLISYSEDHCLHAYAQSIINEIPKAYSDIRDRGDRIQWEQAIKEEIDSLIENKTWDLIPLPLDKNIVDCRWVFIIRNDASGNPFKYKARLVARGFSQEYLQDYDETFAPVARITTFRFVVAFANQYNLLIHQMDVKTAFLNGYLKEEIFMKIPEGIEAPENYVCRLNKALYGLKQSARCWFQRFDEVLRKHCFVNSPADRCLYFLDKGHITRNIYLILYVDDLIIVTYDEITMRNFKLYLMKQFSMKDLNEINLFLGIRVERKDKVITLDQTTYLESVLKKFGMIDCKQISTPLPNKLDYKALNSDEHYDAPCKNLIGSLMYAMSCTRPDLCVSLNLLSRFQVKNNKELWQNLKRVLRYVKGTLTLRLVYEKHDFKNQLIGYVDSDWANNEIDRRSTTGYLFKLFEKNIICWNTRRQNSVAASSTEAEYMALFEGVREACWLRSLLSSINLKLSEPIIIYEDNNGCIAIANNPTDHKRTKHIDVKYHFSRQKVEEKEVKIIYIPTGEQLADAFTKPLPATQLISIRKQIGLKEY